MRMILRLLLAFCIVFYSSKVNAQCTEIVLTGSLCDGSMINLDSDCSGSLTWAITTGEGIVAEFDGGDNTGNDVDLNLLSAGVFVIQVTKSGVSYDSLFTVIFSPTSGITIDESSGTVDDGTVCTGDDVTLTANGTGTSYSWNNGLGDSQSHTISPASTNTYTVVVTGANGCTSTGEAIITVNDPPASGITIDESSGNTNDDGTICSSDAVLLTANGTGTSYVWNNSLGDSQSHSVSPTANTTYTVTVFDAAGCSGTGEVTITVTDPPSSGITIDENSGTADDGTICTGDDVTLVANGTGTSYSWNNGLSDSQSHTISPSSTDTYTVVVTDANGCTSTGEVTITVNDPPASGITVDESSGNSNDDGTICSGDDVILTADGTGNSYNWNNGLGDSQSHTITPTSTTVYNVTVTDLGGCTSTGEVTITVNDPPASGITIDESSGTNDDGIICSGDPVVITANGSGSSYNWNNGLGNSQSHTVNPTSTITYTVVVTDSNGCSSTGEVEITVNDPPASGITIDESSGNTDDDGTICSSDGVTLIANGSGASYSWNNGLGDSQSHTVTPSSNTTYSVVVTDAGGCTSTGEVTITVNDPPASGITIDESSGTNDDGIICSGDPVVLTANGSGSSYNWNNGLGNSQSHTVNPTSTTTYTVVVTDSNGCSSTGEVEITVIDPPASGITVDESSGIINDDGTICSGDGVTLIANGSGTSYSWNNGLGNSQSHLVTPTSNTTYSVVVTDAGGCSNTGQVTITVNDLPTGVLSASDLEYCADETDFPDIILTFSGENSFSYTYTFDGTPVSSTSASTTATIADAEAGTYILTSVIDANGCSATDLGDPIIIIENPTPPITLLPENPAFCPDSEVTISVQEDYGSGNYQWKRNGSNLPGGTNQSISVGVESTDYAVMVTDENGCTNTLAFEVTEEATASVTILGDLEFCAIDGGFTTLEVQGNWSFIEWSTMENTPTISVTASGLYSVEVEDANGCSGTAEVEVVRNELPTGALSAVDIEYCADETDFPDITLNFIGAEPFDYTYSFDGTETTIFDAPTPSFIENAVAGEYILLSVTDANGCSAIELGSPITITSNPIPAITLTPLNPAFCPGSNVTIGVEEDYGSGNYKWMINGSDIPGETDQTTIVNTASTNYAVMVTDSRGCTNELAFIVSEQGNAVVTITGELTFCEFGNTTLSVGNTWAMVEWVDGSTENELVVSAEDTYSVTVTDVNGCSGSSSVGVIEFPSPTAVPIDANVDYCEGESGVDISFDLIGTPPFNVTYTKEGESPETINGINSNTLIIEGATDGVYIVTAIEDDRCSTSIEYMSAPINVEEKPLPVFSIASSQGVIICDGESTVLSATITGPGIYTYLWSNGFTSETITVDEAGEYSLTLTLNGCSTTKSIIIEISEVTSVITAIPGDATVCAEEILTLSTSGKSITWQNSDIPMDIVNEFQINFIPVASGTYSAIIENAQGCFDTKTIEVVVNPKPNPILNLDPAMAEYCEGDEVTFSLSQSFSNYSWSTGENGPTATTITKSLSPGTNISVEVTDGNECTNSDDVSLIVRQTPKASFKIFETVTYTEITGVNTGFEIVLRADLLEIDPECDDNVFYQWLFLNSAGMNVKSVPPTSADSLEIIFDIDDIDIVEIVLVVSDVECACESMDAGIGFEVREDGSCGVDFVLPESFCLGDESILLAEPVKGSGQITLNGGNWFLNDVLINGDTPKFVPIGPAGGQFVLNEVNEVSDELYFDEIKVEFLNTGEYKYTYLVDYGACIKESLPKFITVSEKPSINFIDIDTEICDGEELKVTFEFDNADADWTLTYQINGVPAANPKSLGGTADNFIKDFLDSDGTINFGILTDEASGCTNSVFPDTAVFIDFLDPVLATPVDSCNEALDSVFYSLIVEGGSGDFSIAGMVYNEDLMRFDAVELTPSDTEIPFNIVDEGCDEKPITNISLNTSCFVCFDIQDSLSNFMVTNDLFLNVCSNETGTFSFYGEIESMIDFVNSKNQKLLYVIQEENTNEYIEGNILYKFEADQKESSFSFTIDSIPGVIFGDQYFISVYTINSNSTTFTPPALGCQGLNGIPLIFFEAPNTEIVLLEDDVVCSNEIDYQISLVNIADESIWSTDQNDMINYMNLDTVALIQFGELSGNDVNVNLIQNNLYDPIDGPDFVCSDMDMITLTNSGMGAPAKDSIIAFPGGELFTFAGDADGLCYQWGIDGEDIVGSSATFESDTRFLVLENPLTAGQILHVDVYSCDDTEKVCETRVYYNATEPPRLEYNPDQNVDIKLYPNPNSGLFTINLNGGLGGRFVYQIFDSQGRLIEKANFDKDAISLNKEFDISSYHPGLYFIQLVDEGGERYLLKVVKD